MHHLQNAKNLSPETLIQGAANFLEEPFLLLNFQELIFDSFNSRFYKDKKALMRPLTETSTHAAFF